MFLSYLLTAVITAFIFYLIMRRRSYNKDTPPLKKLTCDDVELPKISGKRSLNYKQILLMDTLIMFSIDKTL